MRPQAREIPQTAARPPEPVFAAARALARLLADPQFERTNPPPAALARGGDEL